jgi:LEA14-like dessication related protein
MAIRTHVRIALLIAPLLLMLSSCKFYKEVEVKEVQNIVVTDFTQELVQAEVTLLINNPNWYAVTLTQSDIDVFVNQRDMGKVNLVEKIKLPSKTTTTYTITLQGEYEAVSNDFLGNLLGLLIAPEAEFKAKGFVKGRALLIGREVPVDITEMIDLRGMNKK